MRLLNNEMIETCSLYTENKISTATVSGLSALFEVRGKSSKPDFVTSVLLELLVWFTAGLGSFCLRICSPKREATKTAMVINV